MFCILPVTLNILVKCKFPKYLWDVRTGELIISETTDKFMNPSEYCTGPLIFTSPDEVRKFLKDNNLGHDFGIKITH